MSDTEQEVVATEASDVTEVAPEPTEAQEAQPEATPAESAAPEVVEETQEVTATGPAAKKEAHEKMRSDRAKSRVLGKGGEEEAPPAEAQPAEASSEEEGEEGDRPRDPKTGQFLSKDKEEAEAQPEATPGADQEAEPDTPEQKPEGFRVEIPEDHPARQGRTSVTHWTFDSQEEAEVAKAFINGTYHRRSEVEELRATLREKEQKEEEHAQAQIRNEANKAVIERIKETPEYKEAVETFHEIRDTTGTEAASRFWQGYQASLNGEVDAEYTKRMEDRTVQRQQQQAQSWAQEAWNRANRLPPQVKELPEFRETFEKAIRTFDFHVQQGYYNEADSPDKLHDAFAQSFLGELNKIPKVMNYRKAAQEEYYRKKNAEAKAAQQRAQQTTQPPEKVAEDAVDKFKKEASQKRADTPPNPLGSIPSGTSRGNAAAGESPEGPDPSEMSPHQLRKFHKQKARGDANRHFNTG